MLIQLNRCYVAIDSHELLDNDWLMGQLHYIIIKSSQSNNPWYYLIYELLGHKLTRIGIEIQYRLHMYMHSHKNNR